MLATRSFAWRFGHAVLPALKYPSDKLICFDNPWDHVLLRTSTSVTLYTQVVNGGMGIGNLPLNKAQEWLIDGGCQPDQTSPGVHDLGRVYFPLMNFRILIMLVISAWLVRTGNVCTFLSCWVHFLQALCCGLWLRHFSGLGFTAYLTSLSLQSKCGWMRFEVNETWTAGDSL